MLGAGARKPETDSNPRLRRHSYGFWHSFGKGPVADPDAMADDWPMKLFAGELEWMMLWRLVKMLRIQDAGVE
jgi:hypothetical protein